MLSRSRADGRFIPFNSVRARAHPRAADTLHRRTLFGTSVGLSLLKQRLPAPDKWLDGSPLIVIEDVGPHKERMSKVRVDEADILEAARSLRGLERLDQIKYAIVERNGEITIVPAASKP